MDVNLRELRSGSLGWLQPRARIKMVFELYMIVIQTVNTVTHLPPVPYDQQYLYEMNVSYILSQSEN